MTGRPEILFRLFSTLEKLPGVGPKTAKLLDNLRVRTPKDLLLTLPVSGIDRRRRRTVADAVLPETVTVSVKVERHIPARQKGRPYRVDVSDTETSFQLVFFHAREDWLQRQLPISEDRVVSGRLEAFDNILQMVHPDHIIRLGEESELPLFEPVYPLTQGISQKVMTKAVRGSVELIADLGEWIEPSVLAAESWPTWSQAITKVHAPEETADLLPTSPSRSRLAYDEFFAHQLTLALARSNRRVREGRSTTGSGKLQSIVYSNIPYDPTAAQSRAISEIQSDMADRHRMNRLLQGDVGSGKTLVAAISLVTAAEAGGQAIMMAPTEILARQHLATVRELTRSTELRVDILTGRDKGAERVSKLKALANGQINILLGTHALFQKDVEFQDLRLAIIDEQHRFGVAQRKMLGEKGAHTDILVMTATPIPRSLNLAQYGDLDVSVLDEKPPGRSPVKTALISAERIDEVVDHLAHALADQRQIYWVCPLVDESEVSDLAAAEKRVAALRARFGEETVGLVHGQLPSGEKDLAMNRFIAGDCKILVATTVIEVGVDVPNASIMVIEHAESFGLAQIHQLRGRVGRGKDQSTCLLMYKSPLSETARRRLEVLRETEDGFRIAEEDLAMRGAGDVLGTVQSGLPEFRIGDLKSQTSLMAKAHKDARLLISRDPELTSKRGKAARVLLWLLEQDRAIRMISIG